MRLLLVRPLILLLALIAAPAVVPAAETSPAAAWTDAVLSQMRVSLRNEVTGENEVAHKSETARESAAEHKSENAPHAPASCPRLGITVETENRTCGKNRAITLNFTGTRPAAGHTVTIDFPLPVNATHIFTPTERGAASLALIPNFKTNNYGAPVHRAPSNFVLPLASIFDAAANQAFTIAIPPDENIPHLQVEWFTTTDGAATPARVLRFTLKHRGIGTGRKSQLKLLFTGHAADYRCAIGAYAAAYPAWFEPVMPSGEFDGAFYYHHILRRPPPVELRRQNVRYIWSSFWFTHLGNYLPDTSEWLPYTFSKRALFAVPGEKMSDAKINKFVADLAKENIGVFAYFNVTEYGGKGAGGNAAEAEKILRGQFANALVLRKNGSVIRTWEGALAMNAGEKLSLWPFLKTQVERHLERLPNIAGFLIDRLDWGALLDYARDDGLTMDGARPAENLALTVAGAVGRVCALTHAKGKRVYVNQFTRVEPLKDTDGYCHETDFPALGYLSVFKPAAAWFERKPYAKTRDLSPHEAQLKKRLQIALFPQLIPREFPLCQQRPDAAAAALNELYTPLFAPFVGKRQVLLPQCVAATGDNDCNLFTDKDGNYLVPLTSRSRFHTLGDTRTAPVTLTISTPDAPKLRHAKIIPLGGAPFVLPVRTTPAGTAQITLKEFGAAAMVVASASDAKSDTLDTFDAIEKQPAVAGSTGATPAGTAGTTGSITGVASTKRSGVSEAAPALATAPKIRSVHLAINGRNFEHATPHAVAINGVPCGVLTGDNGEFVLTGDALRDLATDALTPTAGTGIAPFRLTLTAGDTGAWFLAHEARLTLHLADGSTQKLTWTRPDGVAGESDALSQVLHLRFP
ncbi:MAG: hypothetical protein LBR07_09790 [Puniceicoccales bacterium]|jgi:hypothetical protein|nr:hypothetical protein [Puniceicoccales bacterium]